MLSLSSLLVHLAVLMVALAGLGAMIDSRLRDWCMRVAFALFACSLATPLFGSFAVWLNASVGTTTERLSARATGPGLVAIVLGHLVLAGVLVRRRLRGADADRREAQERKLDRTRGRRRVPPTNTDESS